MPVYEYICEPCNAVDEVIRKMDQSDADYLCPDCGAVCRKKPSSTNVVTKGLEVAYMHPAFGKVMTDTQAKAEAKRMGLIEVGNEDVSKHINGPKRASYSATDYFT